VKRETALKSKTLLSTHGRRVLDENLEGACGCYFNSETIRRAVKATEKAGGPCPETP